jgi:diacylglycerol kinase family enzyme
MKANMDKFDIYLDDMLIYENFETLLLQSMNGRYCGGGMIFDPYSIINDGYLNFYTLTEKYGFLKMIDMLNDAKKKGGIHAYDKGSKYYKGKNMRIVNKNIDKKTG